jgi:hypothetical protein
MKNIRKKDLIYCHNSQKYYWDDTSILRTFEEEILNDVSLPYAKQYVKEHFGKDKEVIDVAQVIMNARLNCK